MEEKIELTRSDIDEIVKHLCNKTGAILFATKLVGKCFNLNLIQAKNYVDKFRSDE